jgi:hypothetical protein
MSWQDDLSTRLQQAGENVSKDIQGYLQARVVDPLVKIGEPAKGNLSAAELAQGARGTNTTQNVVVDSSEGFEFKQYAIPIIAILAVGFLLISKKRG